MLIRTVEESYALPPLVFWQGAGSGAGEHECSHPSVRRLESLGGCHTDGNGHDLHVCDGQLVINGRFVVG